LPLLRVLIAATAAIALIAACSDGRSPASGAADPFAGQRLYVDPASPARRQADAWRSSRPRDAALVERIASRPHADWFGDWLPDPRAAVARRVGEITAAGALPVLVAYAIPDRDCGGWAAGGMRTATAYRRWIRRFADGIGGRAAVVILEPDAVAGLDCLSARARRGRLVLLRDAVAVLGARPRVAVYVDAGNARWHPPKVVAARLRRAGIAEARGFALNVSNFLITAESVRYGERLSARVGARHFVIDTSRNGRGPAPDGELCNPPGRALGRPPTTRTGHPLVDALLWVKMPGESDGACRGAPRAGEWWPDYALGLAARALPPR
jgi:endoglucanase